MSTAAADDRTVYGLENSQFRIRFYSQMYGAESTLIHYTVTKMSPDSSPFASFGSTLDILNPYWTGEISACPKERLYIGRSPLPMKIANARQVWDWCILMKFTPMRPETVTHTQNAF